MNALTQLPDPSTRTFQRVGRFPVILDNSGHCFAAQNIAEGDIVETAPVVPVGPQGRRSPFSNPKFRLDRLAYEWNPTPGNDQICTGTGALGAYGYSQTPNCAPTENHDHRTITMRATRPILAGEQLTRETAFTGIPEEDSLAQPMTDSELESVRPSRVVVDLNEQGWGYGVFATEDIPSGEVVETCPVIVAWTRGDRTRFGRTDLNRYHFNWKQNDSTSAICLGYGGLYNNAPKDDADLEFQVDEELQCIKFVTLRPVKQGQELLHYYGWSETDPRFQ